MTVTNQARYPIFGYLGLALVLLGVSELFLSFVHPHGLTIQGVNIGSLSTIAIGVGAIWLSHRWLSSAP